MRRTDKGSWKARYEAKYTEKERRVPLGNEKRQQRNFHFLLSLLNKRRDSVDPEYKSPNLNLPLSLVYSECNSSSKNVSDNDSTLSFTLLNPDMSSKTRRSSLLSSSSDQFLINPHCIALCFSTHTSHASHNDSKVEIGKKGAHREIMRMRTG